MWIPALPNRVWLEEWKVCFLLYLIVHSDNYFQCLCKAPCMWTWLRHNQQLLHSRSVQIIQGYHGWLRAGLPPKLPPGEGSSHPITRSMLLSSNSGLQTYFHLTNLRQGWQHHTLGCWEWPPCAAISQDYKIKEGNPQRCCIITPDER